MAAESPRQHNAADQVEHAVTAVMAVGLAVVLIAVLLQILFRDVLERPLSWTQELAQYAFVWMVYLGAGIGIRRNIHLRINLFSSESSIARKRALHYISHLCSMILALVFIGAGIVVVQRTWPHTSPAMALPMGAVYAVFPISGVILAYFLLEQIFHPPSADDTGGE